MRYKIDGQSRRLRPKLSADEKERGNARRKLMKIWTCWNDVQRKMLLKRTHVLFLSSRVPVLIKNEKPVVNRSNRVGEASSRL